jgi:hypothetical protein
VGTTSRLSGLQVQATLASVALFGYIRRNPRLRRTLSLMRTMPGFARVYRRLDPLTVNPRFRQVRLADLSPRAQALYKDLAAPSPNEAAR